jgi:hypothetical protein
MNKDSDLGLQHHAASKVVTNFWENLLPLSSNLHVPGIPLQDYKGSKTRRSKYKNPPSYCIDKISIIIHHSLGFWTGH